MMRTSFIMAGLMAVLAEVGAANETAYNPGSFFQSKTVIIPHDDKRHRGGEDSASSNDHVLAVADGVGGWANKGVNPGLFSTELTNAIIGLSEEHPDQSAHQLLFMGCNHAAQLYQGTATVVAIRLLEGLKIERANLGDSGYPLFHVKEDEYAPDLLLFPVYF